MSTPRKLYRSDTNKMFAGVCGGIAEYFNMDATIIRLIFVFLSIFTACFPGLLVYFIAALVIPKDPGYTDIN